MFEVWHQCEVVSLRGQVVAVGWQEVSGNKNKNILRSKNIHK